jgi:hypothetical protein
MSEKSKIFIFIDEDTAPVAEVFSPIKFELDTRKLVEGIRIIPFEVRNGPAIDVVGIKEEAVVDGSVPIMINAYGKGAQKFLIEGSETPQGIPWWVWILIIGFAGWALFYLVRYLELAV